MIFVVVATFACGVTYMWFAITGHAPPSGGTWAGLGFGIAAYALMLFAGLLAVRKRFPTWRIGRAQSWTRAHIWLGLLTLPLVLYHSAFRMGGELSVILMLLLLIVIASGAFGLILQNILPRSMLDRVPLEVSFENIPNFLSQRRRFADDLVGSVCGPVIEEHRQPIRANEFSGEGRSRGPQSQSDRDSGLLTGPALLHHAAVAKSMTIATEPAPGSERLLEFYQHQVRPFLLGEKHRRGNVHSMLETMFSQMYVVLAGDFHTVLDRLHEICEERRQIEVQQRLHRWLHGWLLVHVPLGLALLVLGAIHAIMSLRY